MFYKVYDANFSPRFFLSILLSVSSHTLILVLVLAKKNAAPLIFFSLYNLSGFSLIVNSVGSSTMSSCSPLPLAMSISPLPSSQKRALPSKLMRIPKEPHFNHDFSATKKLLVYPKQQTEFTPFLLLLFYLNEMCTGFC